METAVRHSQVIVESETDSYLRRPPAPGGGVELRVWHCHLVVENRADPDNSHVFVDYSHLFVDRTTVTLLVTHHIRFVHIALRG